MKAQFENKRYIIFLRYGVWAGLFAHVLFALLFLLLGAELLLAFNILSVTIYAACAWLVTRRFITAALMLVTVEIIVHAWLAVWVLGWNSGFHYYIITLMVISAFHPHWPMRGKISYALMACISYLVLNQWSIGRVPILEIGDFTLDSVRWFNTAFTFAFVAYLAHYYAKAARDAEIKLERLAATDTLTGLYNRRQMLTVFEQEQAKLRRNQRHLSIVMMDIDNFKKLNDQFGHECGDNALKAIAACFQQTLRTQDHVARWGGEEFLMLLPETDLKGAQVLAEKMRELASQIPITAHNQDIHITITSGVGELLPDEDLEKCLSRIDQGLLAGKRAGKNQVVVV